MAAGSRRWLLALALIASCRAQDSKALALGISAITGSTTATCENSGLCALTSLGTCQDAIDLLNMAYSVEASVVEVESSSQPSGCFATTFSTVTGYANARFNADENANAAGLAYLVCGCANAVTPTPSSNAVTPTPSSAATPMPSSPAPMPSSAPPSAAPTSRPSVSQVPTASPAPSFSPPTPRPTVRCAAVAFGGARVIDGAVDGAMAIDAADLDGDGDADVAVAATVSSSLAWYESDGDNSFAARYVATDAAGARSVVARADVDGDASPDLVAGLKDENLVAWYAGADAFLVQQIVDDYAKAVHGIFAADLDGDGDADVVSCATGDNRVSWHENDGAQHFAERLLDGGLQAPIAVAVADVDGDGDLDVVASAILDDVVAWYENDGAQSFAKHVVAASAEKVYAVAAADVDGDGATDFVTVDEDADVVTLYVNTGYQAAPDAVVFRVDVLDEADGYGLDVADVDGDGALDVVVASADEDAIYWLRQDAQLPWVRSGVASAAGARAVVAVDVDGDGDLDVAAALFDAGGVAWYENDCDAAAPSAAPSAATPAPSAAPTASPAPTAAPTPTPEPAPTRPPSPAPSGAPTSAPKLTLVPPLVFLHATKGEPPAAESFYLINGFNEAIRRCVAPSSRANLTNWALSTDDVVIDSLASGNNIAEIVLTVDPAGTSPGHYDLEFEVGECGVAAKGDLEYLAVGVDVSSTATAADSFLTVNASAAPVLGDVWAGVVVAPRDGDGDPTAGDAVFSCYMYKCPAGDCAADGGGSAAGSCYLDADLRCVCALPESDLAGNWTALVLLDGDDAVGAADVRVHCAAGSYEDGGRCFGCLDGADCGDASAPRRLEELELLRGYWRGSAASTRVRACLREDACAGGFSECAAGYAGALCASCARGYAPGREARSCRRCSLRSRARALAVVAGVAGLAVAALALVWRRCRSDVVRWLASDQHEGYRSTDVAALRVQIKILYVMMSVVSGLGAVMPAVRFPAGFTAFVEGFGFLRLDLPAALATGCMAPTPTAHAKLVYMTLAPIVLGGALLSWYRWRVGRGISGHRPFVYFLILTYVVFPSASRVCFDAFNCDEDFDGGRSYLRSDYGVRCDSPTHRAFLWYASLMIALWSFGVPSLYAVLVFQRRTQVNPSEASLRARWIDGKTAAAEDEGPRRPRRKRLRESGLANALFGAPLNDGAAKAKLRAERERATRAQVAALFDMADGCHRHELPKEDLDRLVTEFRRAAAHVTRTFDSGDPQAGVGDISFLWASYRPHCYPWELFESSRRLFLEAVLAVVFPDSAHQTVVAFVVSVSSLVALSWIRPYNCLDCNRLSIYAYGFVCIVLFCGLLNVAGLDGSSARARGDLAAFLILCNLGAFCFFVHSAWVVSALEKETIHRWRKRFSALPFNRRPTAPKDLEMTAGENKEATFENPMRAATRAPAASFAAEEGGGARAAATDPGGARAAATDPGGARSRVI